MNRLTILTGKIGSGKTTALYEWIKDKSGCDGILTRVINEQRFFHFIKSKAMRALETTGKSNETSSIKVGKYNFDEQVFGEARNYLEDAVKLKPDVLIVDEAGPLELQGKGFEPSLSRILELLDKNELKHLLIVVRESLLNEFIRHYKIDPKTVNIITKEQFNQLNH
jgi:nucleoside-triphosphatase THEP1